MKQVDLLKFNSCAAVSEFKRNISSQSLLEIVGIERNEVRHSRFIKWLLSDSELNVDNSDSPLFHLLDVIIKRSFEQVISINSHFTDVVCSRYCSLHDVSVEVEHKTQGVKVNGKKGVIDILIRGEIVTHHKTPLVVPFTIAIENKVDSSEHSSQTLKYEAYIKGRDVLNYYKGNDEITFSSSYKCPLRSNEVPIFVYLTPSPESEMGHAIGTVSPNYIHINYQDIVDHILDPINGDTLVSSDKKYKIKQYLTTLSVPSVSLKNAKVNKDAMATAMAVSKNLKELSLSIWNNHGDLIEDAIKNRKSGGLQNQFYETNQVFIRAALNALLVFVEPNSTVYPGVDYYKVKSLVCSMDKKFLIRVNGIYKVVNQTCLAIEFAKHYHTLYPSYGCSQLNSDFASVSASLWSNSSNIKLGRALNSKIDKGLYFVNNIWGSTGSNNYLSKLIKLISTLKLPGFDII